MSDRRVLVVGGGIAGLSAAVSLLDRTDLTVELWEAGPRVGGKITTSPFAGLDHIDEGADAYLTRVPAAVAFAERLGVTDLTSPTEASAAVWHDRLHPIPGGIVLGMPAAIRPFATTSLLSWRGKARAAIEPVLPRRDHGDSLGALMRQRFGDEVHERLVDALVGSIYATDTDRSSLAAVPQLAGLAERHRSLLLGGRAARAAAPTASGPIFAAPTQGMAALVGAAADHVRQRGGTIHTGRAATAIEPGDDGWVVDGERFGAVVIASPAASTARLLDTASPDAARLLRAIEFADVIMVRLAVAGEAWPERLHGRSGYLVPKPDQRFVTAASFGSQKWAHWRPADGTQILRTSLGRDGLPVRHLDDDAVITNSIDDLNRHLDLDLQPGHVSITRWHDAFPQYRPRHHERVAAVEAALPPGLAIAGASYRGIGIPACIADGERAARIVKETTGTADGFLT
ncbi:MAG: protoporphyrinogen oxidase [Ilumatobacteraceae bacterium]|nr:protoporphyrinogen oxidase [Ilumatobacteraceae bacterium]